MSSPSVVPIGKRQHALGFELLVEVDHHRARHHLAGARVVAHEKRQIEDVEFLDPERAELGDRRRQNLHRAELQRLQLLLVLVERGVGIDLHLYLSIGVLLGEVLEHHRGLALGGVWRDHVAKLDDDRLLGHGGARKREAGQHEADGRETGGRNRREKKFAHVSSELYSGEWRRRPV